MGNKYLCVKELIAEGDVYFNKDSVYVGKYSIKDGSVTMMGESGVAVHFYHGNNYFKRQ